MKKKINEQYTPLSKILSLFFALLSLFWLFPIFEVVVNSFKSNAFVNLEPFALPTAESFVGLANYIKGLTFGNYPFVLAAGGTVNLGSFQHIFGNRLQTGNVDDHHVTDLLPGNQNHQTPEAVGTVCSQISAVVLQNAVKDHGPDITQNHAADQIGHKENSTEQIGAPHLLCQRIGNKEGNDIDQNDGDHRKCCGILECIHKACIAEYLHVVAQPHPLCVTGGIEVTEGQVNTLNERPYEADDEGRKGRQDEQRCPLFDRPLNQIHTSSLFLCHTVSLSFFITDPLNLCAEQNSRPEKAGNSALHRHFG